MIRYEFYYEKFFKWLFNLIDGDAFQVNFSLLL